MNRHNVLGQWMLCATVCGPTEGRNGNEKEEHFLYEEVDNVEGKN